uniref:TSA: Wollemia nobilis Ref_Wollemi_Transcript_10069_3442 transcribed RNA sequence n=1 Tax=Wollemia nobilis TaxID=56998 RepID=A0A0C9RMV5_9CONI
MCHREDGPQFFFLLASETTQGRMNLRGDPMVSFRAAPPRSGILHPRIPAMGGGFVNYGPSQMAARSGVQATKAEEEEPAPPSQNLWVGNMPTDTTEAMLTEAFAKYGEIDSISAFPQRNYAFVYFKHVEYAKAAKAGLQGTSFRGRNLQIEFARPENWINPLLYTPEVREGYVDGHRKFMGTADMVRRNFDSMIHLPESPQGILTNIQNVQGLEGGRKQCGPSKVLWIGYPPSVKIDEQRLHNALILFGEIEAIRSFPSRHHAFVEFRSVDEARHAKDGLQGRLFNDPRIQILYSNSDFGTMDNTKDNATFMTPLRGPLPHETPYKSVSPFSSIEMLGRTGPHDLINAPGRNMHMHPLGPWGFPEHQMPEGRIPLIRPEPFPHFFDGNINSPRSSGRCSDSRTLGPSTGARDGFNASALQRESKRLRVNEPFPIAAARLDVRKPDDEGSGHLSGYQGRQPQRTVSEYINIHNGNETKGFRDNQGAHVSSSTQLVAGAGGHMPPLSSSATSMKFGGQGEHYVGIDDDRCWQGTIAKGGTPVCLARCISVGKGIDAKFPEVVNCSARTDLDMLAKHFSQASDFGLVAFLPFRDQDVHSYQEFLHYLGSKHRAGVAKFSDGTTLFLVPPSDFSEHILKVPGSDRLLGVVLKFLQQPGHAMHQNQSNGMLHDPSRRYVQGQNFPISQVDHNKMPLKDDPTQFNTGMPRSFSPSKISHTIQTATIESTNQMPGIQSAVSLTPALISTLSSILPNAFQISGSGTGSLVPSSSMRQDSYNSAGGYDISCINGQGPSPKRHQQPQPLPSHHPRQEQAPYQHHLEHYNQSFFSPHITGSIQTSNNTLEQSGQGAAVSSSVLEPNMREHHTSIIHQTTANELAHLPVVLGQSNAHSGQLTISSAQDYQQESSFNSRKSDSQMLVTEASDAQVNSVSSRLAEQNNGGGSQTLPNVQVGSSEAKSELSSQVQQLQGLGAALLGHNQESLESEAEKNQRYQQTLQFAANLLLQIQQNQAINKSVTGSGQHPQ